MKKIYNNAAIALICAVVLALTLIFEKSINALVVKYVQTAVYIYVLFRGAYRVIEYRESNI